MAIELVMPLVVAMTDMALLRADGRAAGSQRDHDRPQLVRKHEAASFQCPEVKRTFKTPGTPPQFPLRPPRSKFVQISCQLRVKWRALISLIKINRRPEPDLILSRSNCSVAVRACRAKTGF